MTQKYWDGNAIHSLTTAAEADSFDKLTKELASEALSRGKALKLLGAAALGFVAASLFPGVAQARRRRGSRHRGRGRGRICGNNQGCNGGFCVCPGNTRCFVNSNNPQGICL
jgi:hypothetical protein